MTRSEVPLSYQEGVQDGWRAASSVVGKMAARQRDASDGDAELAEALEVLALALLDSAEVVA